MDRILIDRYRDGKKMLDRENSCFFLFVCDFEVFECTNCIFIFLFINV